MLNLLNKLRLIIELNYCFYVIVVMKKFMLFCLITFFNKFLFAQKEILVIGNSNEICFDTSLNFVFVENLDRILDYDIVLIFSGASSKIKSDDISKIVDFLSKGGGLYLGCENWPFQAETNLILEQLFSFQSWGNFNSSYAKVSEDSELTALKDIPSGNSVAVFPMDLNFKVDVWLEDKPVIMSGSFDLGRIVLDGGYSRFFCSEINTASKSFFLDLVAYLGGQKN